MRNPVAGCIDRDCCSCAGVHCFGFPAIFAKTVVVVVMLGGGGGGAQIG